LRSIHTTEFIENSLDSSQIQIRVFHRTHDNLTFSG
jgi:hypothetical protein